VGGLGKQRLPRAGIGFLDERLPAGRFLGELSCMISSELRDLATQSRPSGVVGCPSIGNDISFSTLIRAARVMTFEELVLHVGAVGATHGELLH